MTRGQPYRVPVYAGKRNAGEVSEWDTSPVLYLPVRRDTLPFIRGLLTYLNDAYWWEGTEEDITRAMDAMREQASELALTQEELPQMPFDLDMMIDLEGTLLFRVNEGEWEEAGEVVGPQGPEGPEGPVNAGFYMLSVVDNEDGTGTVYAQWYCRVSATEHLFEPDGEVFEVGGFTGPIGPQGIQGIQGPEGPQGDRGYYYVITADNPEGSPHVVYFYRQLYDPETGEPVPGSPVQQFGGAIAAQGATGPQGPQGEQGEVGPQGPEGPPGPQGPPGPVSYGEPYNPYEPEYDEFNYLGALARMLVEDVSTVAVHHYTSTQYLWNILSMASWRIPGIIVFSEAGSVLSSNVDPLALNSERAEIAKELYCRLVPYRDLSDASINSFYSLYGGTSWWSYFSAGNHEEAVISLIALQMYRHKQEARDLMTQIVLSGEVDPTFDYATLPCTPDLGTWQRVYDFTIGTHGWIHTSGPGATWINGTGFRTNAISGDNRTWLRLIKEFPATTKLLTVEMIYSIQSMGPNAGYHMVTIVNGNLQFVKPWTDIDVPRTNFTQSFNVATVAQGPVISEFSMDFSHDTLTAQDGYIHRISMTGTGYPPSGGSA